MTRPGNSQTTTWLVALFAIFYHTPCFGPPRQVRVGTRSIRTDLRPSSSATHLRIAIERRPAESLSTYLDRTFYSFQQRYENNPTAIAPPLIQTLQNLEELLTKRKRFAPPLNSNEIGSLVGFIEWHLPEFEEEPHSFHQVLELIVSLNLVQAHLKVACPERDLYEDQIDRVETSAYEIAQEPFDFAHLAAVEYRMRHHMVEGQKILAQRALEFQETFQLPLFEFYDRFWKSMKASKNYIIPPADVEHYYRIAVLNNYRFIARQANENANSENADRALMIINEIIQVIAVPMEIERSKRLSYEPTAKAYLKQILPLSQDLKKRFLRARFPRLVGKCQESARFFGQWARLFRVDLPMISSNPSPRP